MEGPWQLRSEICSILDTKATAYEVTSLILQNSLYEMCSCDYRYIKTGTMKAEQTEKITYTITIAIIQSFDMKFGLYFSLILCLLRNPDLAGACVKAGVRFSHSYSLSMSSGMFDISSHVLCFTE